MFPTISGYRILSLLYESSKSSLYRGQREHDDLPVILKMHKKERPSVGEVLRHKREFEIARELAEVPVVIQTYDLLEFGRRFVLVMEDFPGKSLQAWMEQERLPLRRALEIGIRVAEGLGQLHATRVIHKDIKPANILVHPESGQVKIIDFGISTLLPKENMAFESLQRMEGTPAYVSPEQTGRVNRSVDFRTDFYSFGATLYHMLTGEPPFSERDSNTVLLQQISRVPPSPHRRDERIPEILSDVVMKLLAKAPEARYQTARGIQNDLELCLARLAKSGGIAPFPIAQRDMANHLLIPQKLYGREQELETLLAAFDRVRAGARELILISGSSGVGKTVLVQEIHKPLTLQQGIFISGKYDRLDRSRPYSALADAFGQLGDFLLAETEERRKLLGERLGAALGQNGQLILDVFPVFEGLIGPQPAVPALSPAQQENRFHLVFEKFLQVFATREHPLVIFLDDLQWADTPSLALLRDSLTSPLLRHLCVIGAFRENEIPRSHPLLSTIQALQGEDLRLTRIQLRSLTLPDVNQLISETLRCDHLRSYALSELLLGKTEGNPLFLSEFLQGLHREKLLVLNPDSLEWEWDPARIQSHSVPDNVAHFLVRRIQHLAGGTQRLLRLAALTGNPFDLQTLSAFQGVSEDAVLADLGPALQAGLVFPVGAAYRAVSYRFAHDRVQQAVSTLVPEEEKKGIHWKLGQILLAAHPPAQDDRRIFDIVHHLNLAVCEEDPWDERVALSRWNLLAGNRARASSAYEQAHRFYLAGIRCLSDRGWQQEIGRMLALHEGAAEAALLGTDYAEMNRLIEVILERAPNAVASMKAYQLRLIGHTAQHQLNEALDCAIACLAALGIRLPRQPGTLTVLLDYIRLRLLLRTREIERLADLPEGLDERTGIALPILDRMATAAFYASPRLFALTVFAQVRTVLNHGNTPWAAGAYARLGGILCGAFGDIHTGFRLGELALSLIARYPGVRENGSTVFEVAALVTHWKRHADSTLEPLQKAFEMTRDMGDFEYAALSALLCSQHRVFLGHDLARLEADLAESSQVMLHLKQASVHGYNEIFRQMVQNLIHSKGDPSALIGEAYDERAGLCALVRAEDRTGLFAINTLKLVLGCLFGEVEQAHEWATLARNYVDAAVGLFGTTRFYEYDTIVRLSCAASAPRARRRALLKTARQNLKKIRAWSRHSPANHLHWVYLIEAEWLRLRGEFVLALPKYERAIELAEQHRWQGELALANELMARCCLDGGMEREGAKRLDRAYHAYLKWGALAKARQLGSKHRAGGLVRRAAADVREGQKPAAEEDAEQTVVPPLSGGLAGLSALASSEPSVASVSELRSLLRRLMESMLDSAGAERVCLILRGEDEESLRVCAIIDQAKAFSAFDSAEPMDTVEDLPGSLIRYACRTRERLIWDPTKDEERFLTDPYVSREQPRAIACIPLTRPDGMLGVFYLESHRTEEAFRPDVIHSIHSYVEKATGSLPRALFDTMHGSGFRDPT